MARIPPGVTAHTRDEVVWMAYNFTAESTFDALMRADASAASFYAGCTPAQKAAIRAQMQEIRTPEEMRAFVSHLPSAAL